MTTRLKGKFYKTAIRLAMNYGAECCPIKKQHKQKMSVVEMRMLRQMHHKTKKDKIRNECIQEHLGVASIGDKLREIHLRWCEHVRHKHAVALVQKSLSMQVDGP